MMEPEESAKKMGGELSNAMRWKASCFKEQIGDSFPCDSGMLLEGRKNTRSKSIHQHCNAKEMSRGIRNKGDTFVCLNRIWSEKAYRFPMQNYRYPMQKLPLSQHMTVRARNPPKADRDQIPSKVNFSEKILCIRYTEFVTNAAAESSTGS